jgi:kynurenine formamidase
MTAYPSKDRPPTEDEVLAYFESLSNWGRWGEDDQRGTLNHITPETQKRAAAAVRHGISVSCAWELAAGPGSLDRHTRSFRTAAELATTENAIPGQEQARWGSSGEHLCMTFHGVLHTHVDSLCHIFWDGKMYNGRPAELVSTGGGAAWCAVTSAASGMLTRGVVFDLPALRGVPWLEPGEPVFPEDLEAAEERQGVRVESGDAILLRTGAGRMRHETGTGSDDPTQGTRSGWHASCLPWFHDRQVAYIGCDTANDTMPSGYPGIYLPVHAVALTAMGLWLMDNCDLESCAATAGELQQWDFLLSVCPLPMSGVSGSPVNPIATF